MTFWTKHLCLGLLLCSLAPTPAHAQLRGHGGPVKALAISPDGTHAISGSFDTSAIRWSLSRNTAEQVLRFHDGAVNAIVYLKDGRVVTAGADAHIAVWSAGQPQPEKVFDGHSGPVSNLAVSPDGNVIASASWDRSGPFVAGEWRDGAGARGPRAERQRRCVHAGWKKCGERGLRCDAAHLAARRRQRRRSYVADAAQCRRRRTRRRNRDSRRKRQGLRPVTGRRNARRG